ncbi:DNA cytosine methyltransferase [Kitasatospora sp. NPDC056076]|uniref:DNA cytosine methyltransferase n=1 Tax=Kitasatospora sp. NPDC056076 TaxID=3345703 RepID=UPI0035DFF82B
MTAVDWSSVEPIDVLTAGFPCQDLSVAGRRAGLMEGTRSGLWLTIARAIDVLKPRLVIIENVRGILSAAAASPADGDVECGWCDLGDGGGEPALRALGAVLGDLADLGMDARWTVLPAAAVGAPHRRERLFLVAWPSDAEGPRCEGAGCEAGGPGACGHPAEDPDQQFGRDRRESAPGQAAPGRPRAELERRSGAPAVPDPESLRRDARRAQQPWQQGRSDLAVGGGPAAADAEGLGHRDARTKTRGGVPSAAVGGGPADLGAGQLGLNRWGPYGPAIARWERVTRPAPEPTDERGRLAPAFVEWIMGVGEGHVTAVPGLSRSAQLTALGNGVVPQQASSALQLLGVADLLTAARWCGRR